MPELLLALDVGTTSARALLIGPDGAVVALAQEALRSRFPGPGRVEQDGRRIWEAALSVMRRALNTAGRSAADLAGIGVTTQRASTVVWDRNTAEPVAPVLVWSDLRGMARFRALREAGFQSWPQVPACKLEAALDLAEDGRGRAARGELCWGPLDAYLVFRLSGGATHATDLSAAWLTGYLDSAGHGWHGALMAHQGLPEVLFPAIVDSWGPLAATAHGVLGAPVPIAGLIADQQSGMLAHGALAPGAWKTTYGTSAVLMLNTGERPVSPDRTMPAEALFAAGGKRLFCAEGMVVTAGAFIDWLCTGLRLFDSPAALEAEALTVADTGGVQIRPSLQGLGAPHGRFDSRALIAGLDGGARRGHIARAALQAIALRIRDIVERLDSAGIALPPALPVDGGGAGDLLLQLQADTLGRPVRRHAVREATAYGAAIAAGLGVGLLTESDLTGLARYDAEFRPKISRDEADAAYMEWKTAAHSEI